MKHFIKDMKLALIEANRSGIDLGVLSQVLANYEELEAEGYGELGTQGEALAFEQSCLVDQNELLALIKRERVEGARRAVLLKPQNMVWNWWDDVTLELSFWLPAGSFATSVVREIMNQDNADAADIAE